MITKALLQSSMALNVTMYLLLKSELHKQQQQQEKDATNKDDDENGILTFQDDVTGTASAIATHPVMSRLEQWNALSQKLEDQVETKVSSLKEQMEHLVKAAGLVQSGEYDDDRETTMEDELAMTSAKANEMANATQVSPPESAAAASSEDEDASINQESKDDDEDDQNMSGRNVLHEAKFGLRPHEVDSQSKRESNQRKRRKVAFDDDDFGDEDVGISKNKAKKGLVGNSSFASTINAIEQRANKKSSKKQRQLDSEALDDLEDDDDQLREGIRMMEEELGKLDSDDDQQQEHANDMEDADDDGIDNELDDEDFYNQIARKSKEKKAFKKSLYAVAPKYPGIEKEVAGERAISKTILKNRGLVAHKAKINRNPRVKKREQYRKALIRRKGAVREVRTDEGHRYGGEETGIKAGLSRSRKLISK